MSDIDTDGSVAILAQADTYQRVCDSTSPPSNLGTVPCCIAWAVAEHRTVAALAGTSHSRTVRKKDMRLQEGQTHIDALHKWVVRMPPLASYQHHQRSSLEIDIFLQMQELNFAYEVLTKKHVRSLHGEWRKDCQGW